MAKPSTIFNLCNESCNFIDTQHLKSIGFNVENKILNFNPLYKIDNLNQETIVNDENVQEIERDLNQSVLDSAIIDEPSTNAQNNDETAGLTFDTDITSILSDRRLFQQLNSYDCIYDFLECKLLDKRKMKFLAQLLQIYDFQLSLICLKCNLVYNLCQCNKQVTNNNTTRLELQGKFLIDDHTGTIKLTYKCNNFNLNDKQFTIFNSISSYLLKLLRIYGKLYLDSVPICQRYNSSVIFSDYIRNTSNKKPININNNNASSINNPKYEIEFMESIHNYLYNTILNKYYQFEVSYNCNQSVIKRFSLNCLYMLNNNLLRENEKNLKAALNIDCYNIVSFNSLFQI